VVLSANDIYARLRDGSLHVDPLDESGIRAACIDLRLGTVVRAFSGSLTISHNAVLLRRQLLDLNDAVELQPNDYMLVTTLEMLTLPHDVAGYVEGRSDFGRCGVLVSSTSTLPPLFAGRLILEVTNRGNVSIRFSRGTCLASLVLHQMQR
jgi:dCTP deaminase